MEKHEKIYGFCENFCKVEVPTKKDVVLKEETDIDKMTLLTISIDVSDGEVSEMVRLPEKFQNVEPVFIYVGTVYGFSHREGRGFSGYDNQSNTLRTELFSDGDTYVNVKGHLSFYGPVQLTVPVIIRRQ